jgi:glycosyltransferase involved in cell wall biosynthesis
MHTDPKQNDPNDPLVSIFITNYEVRHFRLCLENIFDQDILKNFEIILIDDATSDGSWETALEYLEKYPRRITIQRNRKVLGPLANFHKCLRMAKGRYCTRLSGDQAFLP